MIAREISQRIVKDETVKHFLMSSETLKARASFSESGMALGGRLDGVGSFDVLVSSKGEIYVWRGQPWYASLGDERGGDSIGPLLHSARNSSELRSGVITDLLKEADKSLSWRAFADYGNGEGFNAHKLLLLTETLRKEFATCSQRELIPAVRK